ncbi:hypothetical protein JVU11DRAFT_6493 [Chiua virens]|nr:hypothetical protein JVU11DRAFT_6493 [Chiua virens]
MSRVHLFLRSLRAVRIARAWNKSRCWALCPSGQSYTRSERSVHPYLVLNLLIYLQDIIHYIDAPLTFEALTGPDLTYTLVRPLEDKYNAIQRAGNKAIVFAFLLNRIYFLLAVRILRDNGHSLLDLVSTLTTSWPVWSGADPEFLQLARQLRDDDLEDHVGNAIEMAIISKARRFIKCSPCQRVIHSIWIGKCVYQAECSHVFLSDRYKRTPIHFYDPHKAPVLDHYRLKVPAIRAVLEYINFLILFILFAVAIEMNERHRINTAEMVFMVYALGFTLEKIAAMQEHGIKVYFKGTWNGFDLAFVTAYLIYAIFRIYGIVYHDRWARDIGIDFLAVIACLLFPRQEYFHFDNLLVHHYSQTRFRHVKRQPHGALPPRHDDAVCCPYAHCGILFLRLFLCFVDLESQRRWVSLESFTQAAEFDPIFGPILMITYACLSNTLLLTVLVSILSNTFARISQDAAAEAMFRKAVSTVEGVKADSLFSYQPPINLIAVCILLPASYVLSPRWFHKVNVFLIRITNVPILLAIAWYERQAKQTGSLSFSDTVSSLLDKVVDTLPRSFKRMSLFEGLAGPSGDINVIFDIEDELAPPPDIVDEECTFSEPPHNSGQERRVSRMPSRLSTQSYSLHPTRPPSPKEHIHSHGLHPPHALPRQPSPQRNAIHLRQASTPITLRRRLTPSIHKPDVAQSPLAQIFQPLIFDETPTQEEAFSDSASGGGGSLFAPQISYGPATRRRLTSRCVGDETYGIGEARVSIARTRAQRRWRASGCHLTMRKSPGILRLWKQTEEIAEENGGMPEFMKRMERIEGQQQRIEDLLVQLHAQLQPQ